MFSLWPFFLSFSLSLSINLSLLFLYFLSFSSLISFLFLLLFPFFIPFAFAFCTCSFIRTFYFFLFLFFCLIQFLSSLSFTFFPLLVLFFFYTCFHSHSFVLTNFSLPLSHFFPSFFQSHIPLLSCLFLSFFFLTSPPTHTHSSHSFLFLFSRLSQNPPYLPRRRVVSVERPMRSWAWNRLDVALPVSLLYLSSVFPLLLLLLLPFNEMIQLLRLLQVRSRGLSHGLCYAQGPKGKLAPGSLSHREPEFLPFTHETFYTPGTQSLRAFNHL